MFCTFKTKALRLPIWTHVGATLAAFAAFRGTQTYLDVLYARSHHPVDFATGQLAFDGTVILGYYDAMRAGGTMGVYIQTQLFDFVFIVSVMAFGLLLGTLIARAAQPRTAVHILGLGAAFFAVTGGVFDAVENLLSFAMMQFSDAIPQGLALVYSGCAALKFGALTLAMALALAALLTGGAGWILRKLRGAPTLS